MADDNNKEQVSSEVPFDEEQEQKLQQEFDQINRKIKDMVQDLSLEEIALKEDVYYLWLCWGDFHLYITQPYIEEKFPPHVIEPEYNEKTKESEHVYPIQDYGNRLSTSPGIELASGSRTTGKLLNTVEKIIAIATERSRKAGGDDLSEEVRFSFLGVDVAQRKAYKLCLEAEENIFVTNFDPGEWGERFLKASKELLQKQYLSPPRP